MPKNSRELQRKVGIQLQTTLLDHHNLQVTDYGFVENVFMNLRRKLIERRMMRCLTWRPTYWSGDYLCRQQWNPQFVLAWNMMKIWSHARTKISRDQDVVRYLFEADCGKFIRNFESIYVDVWFLSVFWEWHCAMTKRSNGQKQKCVCLCRFLSMSGTDEWQQRSDSKM